MKKLIAHVIVATMMGSVALMPMIAEAQGRGNKNGHHSKDSGKRGKGNSGRDDRRGNDRREDQRRYEEQRRRDDQRRYAEQRRRDEQRRYEEQRRRDEQRRYEEQRRRNTSSYRNEADRRQQTKNEWRNIAIAAGAVSILGLLQKDSTLTFAGAAGALYATYRYEQDRKSQNRHNRARAHYFSQPYFYRDGKRYDRRTVTRNGQKYYQFVRR